MSEKICKNLCLVSLYTFSIIIVAVVFTVTPKRDFDGQEYILQVEAWINHGSMDVRESDYITAKEVYGDELTQFMWELNHSPNHLWETHSGKIYMNHFGAYSLICVPVKLLLRVFGADEFRCFMITNATLYLVAIFFVYFFANISYKKRLFLLLFLMINPAIYCVTRSGVEIMIFSAVVLGLLFWYREQYKLAILTASVGAMSNIAILFLSIAIGVDYFHTIIKKTYAVQGHSSFRHSIFNIYKLYKKDILLAGCCYLPAFIPIIHTLINFGKINLVASVARENRYLFNKAVAYWFDLNLGIFPYMPIVVILFIILLFIGIKRHQWSSYIHLIALIGIYYILANQVQINSGMAGIMRYNVWAHPILIFYVIYNIDFFDRGEIKYTLLTLSTTLTAIIMIWAVMPGFHLYTPNEFAPWTKVILKYVPQIYVPYHGIFISRVNGVEQYSTDTPVIYQDNNGFARKILIPSSEDMFNWGVIGNDKDKIFLEDCIKNLKNKEYQYISIPYNRKLKIIKTVLDSFEPENINIVESGYKNFGIYPSEGNRCWIQPDATVAIDAKQFDNKNLEIEFAIPQVIKDYIKSPTPETVIRINGENMLSINLQSVEAGQIKKIIIPYESLPQAEDGIYIVNFETNTYFCPREEGLSVDSRLLSLFIYYVGKERG